MSLRSLIVHNFWLKLSSVVLATLIWLAIRANLSNETLGAHRFASTEVTRKFLHHPVLIMTGAGERPAISVEPTQVNVSVRGPADILGLIKEEEIQAFLYLDPQREPSGDFTVVIHAPPGTTDAIAFPDRVRVRPTGRP